jgi:hypothetical protein
VTVLKSRIRAVDNAFVQPGRLDHVFFDQEVRPHLGSLLLQRGLITHDQLDTALEERQRTGELLGETLVRLGYVFEDDIARVLAAQEGLEFVDVGIVRIDAHAAVRLDRELAERLGAIPIRFAEDGLVVAVANPLELQLVEQLESAARARVQLVVSTPSAIRTAWREVVRLSRI